MATDVHICYLGASKALYGTMIGVVSGSTMCHVGIAFTTPSPFSVITRIIPPGGLPEGVEPQTHVVPYQAGSYLYHAHTDKGLCIERLDDVEALYAHKWRTRLLRRDLPELWSTLVELMDETAGLPYSVSQVLNPTYWESGDGIMCVTLIQMYMMRLQYRGYIRQTVSPWHFYNKTRRNGDVKTYEVVVSDDTSYQSRMSIMLMFFFLILLAFYGTLKILSSNIIAGYYYGASVVAAAPTPVQTTETKRRVRLE